MMIHDEPDDTIPAPPLAVIPAGGAELAVAQALHNVSLAVQRLEETAMACARALDAQAGSETPSHGISDT